MQNMENTEVWKQSKKYPNIEVSNMGRVRAYLSLGNSKAGNGYKTVYVKTDTCNIQVLVHRLVAESFKGLDIDDTKTVVLHLDDDGTNNNEENIAIGSQKDNVRDMINKGRGNLLKLRKFTEEQKNEILRLRFSGKTLKEIGGIYGVNASTICRICNGASYRN